MALCSACFYPGGLGHRLFTAAHTSSKPVKIASMRTTTSSANGRRTYLALVFGVGGLVALAFTLIRVRGGFAHPPWFLCFAILFRIQFGLFAGAALAALLYLLPKRKLPRLIRWLVLATFFVLFVWVFIWALVQREFGTELSLGSLWELMTSAAQIAAVGLGALEFALILGISLAIVGALTALSYKCAHRTGTTLQRRVCLILLGSFVIVHLVVRTYFVYHLNRDHFVVLAYDDCAPFSLRSEQLVPGLRIDRIALPNFESETRTARYLDFLRTLRMPAIPRRHNIVWFDIESLRFDAIDERVMPRLSGYRDRFQIKLDRQHWSGGNATPWGVFSMLTGVSGYHVKDFQWAGMNDPFLTLLVRNGYRLRVANQDQIDAAGLSWLFPAGTVFQRIGASENEEEDRRTIDGYLKDRAARQPQKPALDFVALDSTHLPYAFPAAHAIFQPAPELTSSHHVLRSKDDLEIVRNRYRNGCHYVDELIGRVLDDLDLDNTIVVITGDHGEEFQERGQLTHAGVLNDFQGRTVLWMHFPKTASERLAIEVPTVHMDIVPTLLEALGFGEDILHTQGRSLLSPVEKRPMLSLCEHLSKPPRYRALVTDTYISRWRYTARRYLFSGVQRRDGAAVEGEEWLSEVRQLSAKAAEMYEILPDVSLSPLRFETKRAQE